MCHHCAVPWHGEEVLTFLSLLNHTVLLVLCHGRVSTSTSKSVAHCISAAGVLKPIEIACTL